MIGFKAWVGVAVTTVGGATGTFVAGWGIAVGCGAMSAAVGWAAGRGYAA